MEAPHLIKPIPAQIINERAAYGPFDLKNYIQTTNQEPLIFRAEMSNGQSLPKGLICTSDGVLTGIPGKDTQGNYEILVTANSEAGSLNAKFLLTIKPGITSSNTEYIDKLKSQIWEALGQNLPVPDFDEMFERPITALDIYYLLERWGTLTIWDAFNLEPPDQKVLLDLKDASPHYLVYDRGSSLIAVPKDLFSHERTILDGLKTAQAMAREVYERGWTIELAGFDKMTRAAWVEIQQLGDEYGKRLEIINFRPSPEDVRLYASKSESLEPRSNPE